MDIQAIAQAVVTVGAPALAAIGIGGRRRRLRNDIKENLALIEEVEKHAPLREQSLSSGWLQGRIALDIAKLTGQDLGTGKKPISKSGVFWAAVFGLGFGYLTYWLNRDAFQWYSVFPGIFAALFGISLLGMFTNRDLPPEERGLLPQGAVRAATSTASERIATSLAIAASGGIDDRLQPGHQADVALRFLKLMQLGAYSAGIELADANWLRCRAHAWVWNNRSTFGETPQEIEPVVEEMLLKRDECENWKNFSDVEAAQFVSAWGSEDFDKYGIAGNRRRVARDLDLVILAPVGDSGGYFVMSATALPDAFTLLMQRVNDSWLVSNHVGIAPPVPGWPPTWWVPDDEFLLADSGSEPTGDAEGSTLDSK